MTRRNQKNFSQGNHKKHYSEQRLVKKLDLRRLSYFRYDVKEIFNSTNIEDKVWNPLSASIVTKASRLSIKDAKEYILKLEMEETLSKETANELIHLLDKYKRFR